MYLTGGEGNSRCDDNLHFAEAIHYMRYSLPLMLLFNLHADAQDTLRVGININTPSQTLDVNGKIKIGDDANLPEAGVIRWGTTSGNFEGFNGTKWVSLTELSTGKTWGTSSVTEIYATTGSDSSPGDEFGYSVDVFGDYAIAGARFGAPQFGYPQEGEAYVFKKNGAKWTEEAVLTADDGEEFDNFGSSVSISDEYAIVGAPGIFGGAAYVFNRNGSSWTQEETLIPSGNDALYESNSISISGNRVIIGGFGKAYVFKRESNTVWTEEAILTASESQNGDYFGRSVSISDEYAIVGAWGADAFQGAAYIFKRNDTAWTEEARLVSSDGTGGDNFGRALDLSGDYAVIGAAGSGELDQGKAYIFKRNGIIWTEVAHLNNAHNAEDDHFGWSVSISGNHVIVGSLVGERASVFKRLGSVWREQAVLNFTDGAPNETFGKSVAIYHYRAIVSAAIIDFGGGNMIQEKVYFFGQ